MMGKSFVMLTLRANVTKPMVIYCHSMVIVSFSVIKLYYLSNYGEIAVNYNIAKITQYYGNKLPYLTPEKEVTVVPL